MDRSVSAWRDRARPPQLDVEVFDGPARLNEFRHAVAEMPLFDPERALLLRDPPQLTGSAKRGGIDPPERLVAVLAELAPTTVLCMVAHAKVPDRNAVLAAVRARGGSIVFHAAVKGRDLRAWVDREIGERGLRLGAGSVDHLIRVAGPDLGSIASELDKLLALAAGRPLSIAEVRTAVAGDEAAGLYDTLGELLGPTPAKGAEFDRPAARRGPGRAVPARHPCRTDPRPRPDPGLRPATRVGRRPGGGARKTGLAGRSPQPSGPKRVSGARRRLACGAARRRSKAQVRRDRRDRRAPPRGPSCRCGADGRARPAPPLSRGAPAGGVIWPWTPWLRAWRLRRPSVPEFSRQWLSRPGLCLRAWRPISRRSRAPAASHCVPWRRRPPPNEPRLPRHPLRRSRVRAAIDARRDLRRRTLFRCSTPFSAARSSARMAACNSASLPVPPSSSSA